jgi:hypothetical protein
MGNSDIPARQIEDRRERLSIAAASFLRAMASAPEPGRGLPGIQSVRRKMRLDREVPEIPKVEDLRKKSITPAKWDKQESLHCCTMSST